MDSLKDDLRDDLLGTERERKLHWKFIQPVRQRLEDGLDSGGFVLLQQRAAELLTLVPQSVVWLCINPVQDGTGQRQR